MCRFSLNVNIERPILACNNDRMCDVTNLIISEPKQQSVFHFSQDTSAQHSMTIYEIRFSFKKVQ